MKTRPRAVVRPSAALRKAPAPSPRAAPATPFHVPSPLKLPNLVHVQVLHVVDRLVAATNLPSVPVRRAAQVRRTGLHRLAVATVEIGTKPPNVRGHLHAARVHRIVPAPNAVAMVVTVRNPLNAPALRAARDRMTGLISPSALARPAVLALATAHRVHQIAQVPRAGPVLPDVPARQAVAARESPVAQARASALEELSLPFRSGVLRLRPS
jgi:hypothetical protein